MRMTENTIEIAEGIFCRFVEGKDKEFLNGYLVGISEYDELEAEKIYVLEEFICALFNYIPQK